MDKLPYEIKMMIISYLPCYKFIKIDTNDILPIFNEYIMYYINNKLLTDNYSNCYLYNCKLYRNMKQFQELLELEMNKNKVNEDIKQNE
jgi:hypothetical protein